MFPVLLVMTTTGSLTAKSSDKGGSGIQFPEVGQVKIEGTFWKPKLDLQQKVTVNDVFDEFEGKHLERPGKFYNTFENFNRVAKGERNIGQHAGAPWFDELVYETIRGVTDLVVGQSDITLEKRVDGYIDRIAKAQASKPNGYINTYTQLMEADHQQGERGGMLRWQRDMCNAGMLVEAGIHYYNATGKTKLLEVVTRYVNLMTGYMGAFPKKNVVPARSGPGEALVKLYIVYKNNPELKKQISVPVAEQDYLKLVEFWIEGRGHHCEFPLWGTWGNPSTEQWIRSRKYEAPEFGNHARPSWGDYAQDSTPLFKQETIEGHAIRATSFATGATTATLESHSPEYIAAVSRLWDNMIGKRMLVIDGVSAVHFDEKFGPDYFLPTDVYLETCAAAGASFFSQGMDELTDDAKYMDELERTLYNNVLTGISFSGTQYTYQNPLNSAKHARWSQHGCPCCPPMFLKMMSTMPGFIYSWKGSGVCVNLFVGSETEMTLADRNRVCLTQKTGYPWEGVVTMTVEPEREKTFILRVRIPGWAQGVGNPYGLYRSEIQSAVSLKVNDRSVPLKISKGYAEIQRKWKKGDQIELILPVQPRLVTTNEAVADLQDEVAIAAGPFVYCLEGYDNEDLADLKADMRSPLSITSEKGLLNGINVIKGQALDRTGERVPVMAVPYYALGNHQDRGYAVWVPASK